MMTYENTDVAFAITKANPQFGDGGVPQMFVPDFNKFLVYYIDINPENTVNNKINFIQNMSLQPNLVVATVCLIKSMKYR